MISTYFDETLDIEQAQSSNTSVIDLSYLNSICHGDKAFITEMVNTFLANTPAMINQMQNWSNQANWTMVYKIAHKMKPSIDFMGIEKAKILVKEIENSGKQNIKTDSIPEQINQLGDICQQAFLELKDLLKDNFAVLK